MTRIIVVGATGFFGAAALAGVRSDAVQALGASRRRGCDVRVDAEDVASLRAALRPGDVVIDAAGPFHTRSMALVETCLSIGCDVIDLADSLDYVRKVQQLSDRVEAAGSRVLTACSSVSAVSASLVRLSGISNPVRVSVCLAPATRTTSTDATARSLFSILDRPARVLRDGRIAERLAFSERRRFDFPAPVGVVQGRLAESADMITLPGVWPSLRTVDFWVDARRRVLNSLLAGAARSASLRSVVRAAQPAGRALARRFGKRSGGFCVEIEDDRGRRSVAGFLHPAHSYVVAVAPAVLAARRLASGTRDAPGLIPADRQVDPWQLLEYLRRTGVPAFGITGSLFPSG